MYTEDSYTPPPDILVTGHFKERYGYAVYRARGSGNWLITYTLQGQGLYRQAGMQIWANPGDIVLLQLGALHDYSVFHLCLLFQSPVPSAFWHESA